MNRLKIDIQLVGYLPVVGSALAMVLALGLSIIALYIEGASSSYQRWVTYIVPLAIALQVAFVLSPCDEHALEILLASPYSMARILLQRLGTIGLLNGSVALIGTMICLIFPNTDSLWRIIIGWLVPSVCLAGIALWVTQVTQQGAYSALTTLTLWGAMILGGDVMIRRWPALWPFHLFLRPEEVSPFQFIVNRIVLLLVGLILSIRAAQYLRNEEHMLGIRSMKRKQ